MNRWLFSLIFVCQFCCNQNLYAESIPDGCYRSSDNPSECWTPQDNIVDYDTPVSSSANEKSNFTSKYGDALTAVIFDQYDANIQCIADKTRLTENLDKLNEQYNRIIGAFTSDYNKISSRLAKANKKIRQLHNQITRLKHK